MGADHRLLLKHGHIALNGSEVELTAKGERLLLGILFEQNQAKLVEVVKAQLAEQAQNA